MAIKCPSHFPARFGCACAVALAMSVATFGCAKKDRERKPSDTAQVQPDTSEGQAPTPEVADACQGARDKHGQSWFDDDFERARACARQRGKPLFVDLWAPWCHTCISMQEYIFPDKGLAPLADRFVWLAIDTDKEKNAGLQERLPPEVWPTFYIVSPEDLAVQGRYLGAASVTQLREFLVAGEQAALQARAGGLPPDSPLRYVRDGDRAVVKRDFAAAATAYRKALEIAPEGWPRRPDVLVSLIGVLSNQQDHAGCVALAESSLAETGDSASVTDFSYRANRCADHLAATDTDKDKARADALRDALEARLLALIDNPEASLSVDDRSDAMVNLRTVYLARDKRAQASAIAERQLTLLDTAAAEAPSAWAAMTYNWPRAEVYVFLGRGEELVPALEKSMADLPREYDPPYRLAWVLLSTGQAKAALAPAEKALGLIYGPRKARAQILIADIYKALGDKASERQARARVVEIYEALPPGQAKPKSLEAARKALAALDGQPSAAKSP